MQNSDQFVQAFDKFRDDNPGWHSMVPYAVARLFWDAAAEFTAEAAPGHGVSPYITMGHIAEELSRMKSDGMTREAVLYVVDRIFMEEEQGYMFDPEVCPNRDHAQLKPTRKCGLCGFKR